MPSLDEAIEENWLVPMDWAVYTTAIGELLGVGEFVGVTELEGVWELEGVSETVGVGVLLGVFVGEFDGVDETVGVGVFEGVTEIEDVGELLTEIVAVGELLGVFVGVLLGELVGELEGDLVGELLDVGEVPAAIELLGVLEIVGVWLGELTNTLARVGRGKGATAFLIEKEVFAQEVTRSLTESNVESMDEVKLVDQNPERAAMVSLKQVAGAGDEQSIRIAMSVAYRIPDAF